jgi:hypothetical protein
VAGGLETREELEILHKVRRLERKVEVIELLCFEILQELRPTYHPPLAISVMPIE